MVKIFITGCAKSGTTLLADMFRAFERTYVIHHEISLEDFCKLGDAQIGDFDFVVGKRNMHHLFSHPGLTQRDIARQIYLIRSHKIAIVNIIRDGRNVVASQQKSWGIYNPFDWMGCIKQANELQKYIDASVYYEELISKPDVVQLSLSEKLSLRSAHLFSNYPDFIPPRENVEDAYRLRPLEFKKADADKTTYLQRPNDIEYFNRLLTELNYKV